MSIHDDNYLLQEALAAYLSANLATYAGGVAASLPIITGGDFGNRDGNHIYLVAPEMVESTGVDFGSFACTVIAGVATLKETAIADHRALWRAVCDLMMELDIAAYVNALAVNALRINQRQPGAKQRIGADLSGTRFAEVEISFMVYQVSS